MLKFRYLTIFVDCRDAVVPQHERILFGHFMGTNGREAICRKRPGLRKLLHRFLKQFLVKNNTVMIPRSQTDTVRAHVGFPIAQDNVLRVAVHHKVYSTN